MTGRAALADVRRAVAGGLGSQRLGHGRRHLCHHECVLAGHAMSGVWRVVVEVAATRCSVERPPRLAHRVAR